MTRANTAIARMVVPILSALVAITMAVMVAVHFAYAQENSGEMEGMMTPMNTPGSGESDAGLPPIMRVPMRQPVSGSMLVSPPYGRAPLRVGFFVIAEDPENIGFLSYEWHYGDGTVSALPPELYIFHTYKMPGNYVCTLVLKTTDGRSKTLFQGVVVRPRSN